MTSRDEFMLALNSLVRGIQHFGKTVAFRLTPTPLTNTVGVM